MTPEVLRGDSAEEYFLGDPAAEIIFGVPVGVSLGVIYGVMENFCTACCESVDRSFGLVIEICEQHDHYEHPRELNSNKCMYTCEARSK